MEKTSIIFSPHPDDACLGCGGVISKKIKSGEKVIIVDVTDGRNSHLLTFGIGKDPTPRETAILRKNEEINAMNLLGVPKENIYFLDYEDGFLYENDDDARKKIFEIIKKIKPSEIYIPCLEDSIQDHVFTNIIVKESLKRLNLDVEVYEYFIQARPKFEKTYKKDIIKIDISDEIDKKKTAIQFYKSQITKFSSNQKTPVLEDEFLNYFYNDKELFRKIDSHDNINIVKYLPILFKIKFIIPIYLNLKFRQARLKEFKSSVSL